jgi:hypothetical protein
MLSDYVGEFLDLAHEKYYFDLCQNILKKEIIINRTKKPFKIFFWQNSK